MSKSSVKISIRLPIQIYNDLKEIQKKYPTLKMSKLIVFATAKDIQRYKE